jgi:hypothetical protein
MSEVLRRVSDKMRTMFGVRRERRGLPPGKKPKIGGLIVKGERSMDITHALTDEQWGWLVLLGWCSVDRRKERRQYFSLPKNACELLVNSNNDQRELLLERLMNQ